MHLLSVEFDNIQSVDPSAVMEPIQSQTLPKFAADVCSLFALQF